MKKINPWLATLFALAFVLDGCSSGSSGSSTPTAPDVGTAADLPATGATKPADKAAALSIFTEATSTLMDQIMLSGSTPSKAYRSARYSSDDSGLISWTGSYGGGTVNFSGHYASKSNIPDNYLALAFGGSYPNTTFTITSSLDAAVNGTVTGVQLTDNGSTYTVSGTVSDTITSNTNCLITTKSSGLLSDAIIGGTYAINLRYGTALSIKNDKGVGAKYIISVAASGSGVINDPDEKASIDGTATLTVYDDTNTPIYTIDLTSEEIPGLE